MIRTPLCDLLDIQYPIIQGGMAWVADASLAAAVSNGGGLGLVSAMNASPDWLRGEIRKAKEMTDKTFGVNIYAYEPLCRRGGAGRHRRGSQGGYDRRGKPRQIYEGVGRAGIRVLPVVPSTAMARLAARGGACAVIAEGTESGGHVGSSPPWPLFRRSRTPWIFRSSQPEA